MLPRFFMRPVKVERDRQPALPSQQASTVSRVRAGRSTKNRFWAFRGLKKAN